MTVNDGQERRRVLYLILCAAPPASEAHELVKLAQAAGWEVCVIATPEAMHWIEPAMLAELTGYDVRSEYRAATEAKSLPEADAIAVAPATFNTVNKFRAGIADNMAVGVLCECLRAGVPIVLAPNVKAVLADHPAFAASLRELASWGVHVLEQAPQPRGVRMAPWEAILEAVERHVR
jgi:phosphopantothenoylcysteine synthetase/decarboxylase